MMMSRFIRFAFVLSSLFMASCAGHVPQVIRTPQVFEWELGPDTNAEVWKQVAQDVSQQIPEYQIQWKATDTTNAIFNRIQTDENQTYVCMPPRWVTDIAGNMTDIIPMSCHTLDTQNPKESFIQALDAAQSQKITLTHDNAVAFRAETLAKSTPQNPLCFSVYPAIFAADTYDLSPALEEAYLIACADRIQATEPQTWQERLSARLSQWLKVEAALLSTQNTFIARAFKAIAEDDTREGMIYGLAIEAYTEFLAQKTRQTEITALAALQHSDRAALMMLSRQTAMRLTYIVALADTMDGERIEAIVRALAPANTWPAKIQDYRRWLQIKACQSSVIIPDIAPSLVSACLPWLETALTDVDELDMALMLVEHGMYGATKGTPGIADDVFTWLQNIPQTEQLTPTLREFISRIQTHPSLTDAQRTALKNIMP